MALQILQVGFGFMIKQQDWIFKSNPDSTFFENDLNTVAFPSGEKDDLLETLYTNMENSSWACLDRIRTSTRATPVDIVDKMHLFRFLIVFTLEIAE